ncbi:hypothetical protein [Burkholderia gladioli]|uniref:hypothetical protein n=1 Tax=Burkholderia gladioli TaxID=28095 RepID=UPI00163EEACE|nr:hypothetical protein [Burkholderia gladioli]URV27507.1 hypothetical protein NAL90_30795 [Burkholderia gladioli]
MRAIGALLLSICCGLFCGSALAAGQVIGGVDGFGRDASGNPVLSGWTCQVGNPAPIQVDLYLNQPYSPQAGAAGFFAGRFAANQPSEPAIASQCGTGGANYRFSITLASSQYLAGSSVFAYGILPTGGTQLSTGASFRIPANPNGAVYPGSVATGTSLVVYDTFYDSGSGCAPLIDTALYPISFPSPDGNGVLLKFPVLSDDGRDLNYLVTGQMNAQGAEVQPFHANCAPTLASPQNADSNAFEGNMWLAGFYKAANGDVYSLVHNEYYGGRYPDANFLIPSSAGCSLGQPAGTPINALGCTYASLSIARMPAGSASFSLVGAAPQHVAARPQAAYAPNLGRPAGYFTNTNIVSGGDGYYYALTVDNLASGGDRRCPIRTQDIGNPAGWKGWDGSAYTIDTPHGADCVDANGLGGIFPFYLGYSTTFQAYIVVGAAPSSSAANAPAMIAYALSKDFVHWSQPVSFDVPIFNSAPATGWTANNYASLLDVGQIQNSQDDRASTGALVGQTPWLVFQQRYVCAPGQDPDCPPAGRPPRTRYTAVPLSFSIQ